MRPHLSRPHLHVCLQTLAQCHVERLVLDPTVSVAQGQIGTKEASCNRRTHGDQRLCITLTGLGDELPEADQLRVPRRDHGCLPRLERGVSLTKHLAVALPVLHELMFHVEHTPVQEAPPSAGSFLDESMYLGIYDLYRQM